MVKIFIMFLVRPPMYSVFIKYSLAYTYVVIALFIIMRTSTAVLFFLVMIAAKMNICDHDAIN